MIDGIRLGNGAGWKLLKVEPDSSGPGYAMLEYFDAVTTSLGKHGWCTSTVSFTIGSRDGEWLDVRDNILSYRGGYKIIQFTGDSVVALIKSGGTFSVLTASGKKISFDLTLSVFGRFAVQHLRAEIVVGDSSVIYQFTKLLQSPPALTFSLA